MLTLPQPERRPWDREWRAPMIGSRCHFEQGRFRFLGEEGSVRKSTDWNNDERSRLWLYNLHYFDDLNAVAADSRPELQEWMVRRWTEENPPMSGVGWEPYPLSLRIVNLVKWYGRNGFFSDEDAHSLALQSQALSAQVERHILANHLFANGKALVFAGAFFAGAKGELWLEKGLSILDREVPEQFLADGGHFELSPLYHSILLWDLCDLLNLAERSSIPSLLDRAACWKEVVGRGLQWARAMCHPDGEISFFNDAAFKVSPSLDSLREYAGELGVYEKAEVGLLPTSRSLEETGYFVVEMEEGSKAILDLAEVGPRYQPGHAHADSLSFELSLFGHRVIVNSGTSLYGRCRERGRQRSTSAHSTVEIDQKNSSEIWSGFRVARRAYPKAVQVTDDPEGTTTVRCSHNGYRWLPGSPFHTRQWQFGSRKIAVTDRIEGKFETAVARFHLHPDVFVGNDQSLKVAGRTIVWAVKNGTSRLVQSSWHPEFGKSIESNCLEVSFTNSEITTEFTWE